MASVLDLVRHYQHNIEKYPDDEQKVLRAIEKLYQLGVTVQHLQDTGVGRTVNALRKEPGHLGQAARALVYKWKCMVASEESDQEDDHNNSNSTNGNRRDSGDSSTQQERYDNPTTGVAEHNEHKYVNGDCDSGKRRHHSSEDEEPDHKKSKHSSSSERESHKGKHEQSETRRSESESEMSTDSQGTDSESEEDIKPQVTIKTEPVDTYTKYDKYSASSALNEFKVKKEPTESKLQEASKSHSKHRSENKHEKSKERSSSSQFEKTSKDTHKTSSEHKTSDHKKSEHMSSEKEREKIHKKSKSSDKEKHKSDKPHKRDDKPEKHDSISHKSKSSSEKHKSSSHKSSSSSEKHKSHDKSKPEKERSSSSHRSEKEKHKSSSEKDAHSEKKSKHSSGSKDESSSKKEKSKESSSQKEKSGSHKSDKKHSSSRDKSSSESKNREKEKKNEKSSEKSSHKSSSSSHKSKSSSSKSGDVKPKQNLAHSEDSDDGGGIDCGSGASFAEVLGMINPSKSSKKKSTPVKDTSSPSNYFNNDLSPASLLAPTAKLAPLPAIEISALPEISPNYRPRPPPKFLPHFTEEDAISAGISSKNQRTKVYSGNKTYGKIPTLYEMCVHILQEHIDALEYTGGVPYDILKPVVDKATPQQLFMLEHHNPYLMEDTDHLWQKFCEKHFRTKKRQEMETWRDMYMRCQEEQEHKLKSLTANIRMTQEAKKAPIKQTKMAYVDTVVKPPRNIARKQALHGTAYAATASPAARVAALAKTTSNVLRPGAARPPPAAPAPSAASFKPKKAPLMQKALQFMRGRKR